MTNYDVIITNHAVDKAKKRQGISSKALKRMTYKALQYGLDTNEMDGKLYEFVTLKLKMQHDRHEGTFIKAYGEFLYIFFIKTEINKLYLLTTYQIPKWCRNQATELVRAKKERLTKQEKEMSKNEEEE